MKTTLLALLCLGVLVTACNEKVSPDLGNAATATSSPGDSTPPSVFSFAVTNTAPAMLNYKIHRTGALDTSGNLKECKISSTSAFNNANFIADNATSDHDSKVYDISCFYETEEQNLWYNGIDFTVEASKNTCEYVGYAPYSFYQYQPGDSSGSLTHVTSGDTTATPCSASGITASGSAIPCDHVVDNGLTPASRVSRTYDVKELCLFDYTEDRGPNCDEGKIVVRNLNCVSGTCTYGADTKVDCGGKAYNCVKGPIKKESLLSKYTRGSVSTRTEIGVNFTKKWTLGGAISEGYNSSNHLVNFRRDLSNPNIDFTDHTSVPGYASRWNAIGNTAYLKKFDPRLMDRYSSNKLWDGTTDMISAGAYTTAQNYLNRRLVKPLAAESFVGMGSYRVNPFYIFYCFDAAFDVKARIRMVVRDWDRVLPAASTPLTLLTDITDSANDTARQDNSFNEIDGDNDGFSGYNDVADWDDLIFMSRTGGALVPAVTIWEPETGFFDPRGFMGRSLILE